MGLGWHENVSTPALVIDYNKLVKNIETMANFAKENKVNLRPHIKTHKCPKIGQMQLEAGASGICVATIGEAEVFTEKGFNDILIANEVVEINKMIRLIEINKKNLVRVCVDSKKNINDLSKLANKVNVKLEVLIDIDVGLGRTGVKPGKPVLKLAKFIKELPNLELVGFMGYEGHLTYLTDFGYKKQQTELCMKMLVDTRDLLNENGFEIEYITTSGSGTYMIAGKYPGITEIQPGTYPFFDEHMSKCVPNFEIALTILATINNQTGKRNFTLDMGSKACSTADGKPIFKEYSKSKMTLLTEEHGQFKAGKDDSFEIGQKVELIPGHVCPTVNLYDFFNVIKDDKLIDKWEISARGKNY